jgi:hypothetical protein
MAALSQVIEKVINFVFFHIWNRHWAVLLDAFLGYAIFCGSIVVQCSCVHANVLQNAGSETRENRETVVSTITYT